MEFALAIVAIGGLLAWVRVNREALVAREVRTRDQ
jgi:hypothetical protein